MRAQFLLPITFLSLIIISSQAFATESVLCIVSSDIDNDIGKIVYQMDDENRSILHLYQDSYHDGKLVNRIELKSDSLKEGIVLNRKDKYITVRMHSDNYDNESGGILYLDTLYSGISGERREYEMQMAMEKDRPVLLNNKEEFTQIKFIANRSKIFGIIGVAKVNFNN